MKEEDFEPVDLGYFFPDEEKPKKRQDAFDTDIVVFTAKQQKLVDTLNEMLANSKDAGATHIDHMEYFRKRVENLKSLAAAIAEFPSLLERTEIANRERTPQSLIESLEVQEKRLLELEAQAANVEDLLDIEDRLQSVRSNLTIQRNALSRLDTDVSYSTVMITLTDVSETGSTPSVREGLGESLGSGAVEAWDDFVEGLEDFLVDVVSVWPQLLITIAIVVLIIVLLVKRSKKVKAERERMMLDQSQAPQPQPQPQPQVGDKPEKAKKVANKELDRNVSDK